MPPGFRTGASKRTLEEIAQQEDPDDDDYDDRAPGPSSKPRHHKSRGSGPPARKKQRRAKYGGSDVDSDDEELVSESESFEEEDSEDEVETNEKGRPVRRSAKKVVKYEESSDEDELSKSPSPDLRTPPKRGARKLIITLKTTPGRPPRNLRSGSYGGKQPTSSSAAAPDRLRRRSRRLSHDEEEAMFALTNSGNHAEVTRAGSRDPEVLPARATRGGKGIKYPSKSTIDEESQPMATEEGGEEMGEEELEIKASQHELLESDPHVAEQSEEQVPKIMSDIYAHAEAESDGDGEGDFGTKEAPATQEDAPAEEVEGGGDEDDDDDVVPRGRLTRGAAKRQAESPDFEPEQSPKRLRGRGLRGEAKQTASQSRRRKAQDESSDFDPDQETGANQDEMSSSSESEASPRKNDEFESSNNGRRSTRLRSKAASRQTSEDSADELAAEVADLKKEERKKRREREEIVFEPRQRRARDGKKPNYDLLRNLAPIEDEEEAAPSPSQQRPRRTAGGGWQRSLFNTYGPFGGGGSAAPVLGGGPPRAQGGVDSDSSDDEVMKPPRPMGGTVGMTPTAAGAPSLFPQPLNADPAQATGGTPANLGKLKDKQALADADPLGVDQNVDFDSVGGLQGHIDQLKEMVALPLLYPEIFMRFKITPPRGVLFHGPPGTGKTLLARALATSVSSQGRKVTFYMRKGADALSKWVGEAERQLRLLFEEARKNQPSIIFFDEIDGLAPVRSSKQEQIHASIVSTLLALMDGMDGRGQVVVIGATNRPDSIDPALRRPGRFDREFYFPLPNTDARRAIIDIHTRGWDPPLPPMIKDELAEMTKGYGGADLRALCTEAALNAVQRRYPQIYNSTQKLIIDPKTIEVTPKDFMISIKKMTPSSERSTSSGASPLPSSVAPLLSAKLKEIEGILAEIMPRQKKLTALEEAQYEDAADGHSFGRERMQQAFETARVFRPRLLIKGKVGMGQQYLAGALLNHFEGLHVQAFDLPTLLGDSTSSAEATLIRLFSEVKMHKPSVIYIPNVHDWYTRVGDVVIKTFLGLLRAIKPTDPVLLLGYVEVDPDLVDEEMQRDLFGYSTKNQFLLEPPDKNERYEFFRSLKDYIRTAPDEFPHPKNRKKRQLEQLEVAPPEPEKGPASLSKEELKAQKKKDRLTLNMLKLRLQPIMDQIRTKYKKFRTGVIDEGQIRYLYDEADPTTVTSDIHADMHASFRPFEIGKDAHGVLGLVDQASNNFYYNLDSVTIEKRLSNGYYKRPKDFLADIKRLAKDAKTVGDEDRLLKANELVANVEVDIANIEITEPALAAECERVYERELAREKEVLAKARAADEQSKEMPPPEVVSNVPHGDASGPSTTTNSTGPILLGEPMQRRRDFVQRLAPVAGEGTSSESVVTNGIHLSHDEPAQTELTNGSHSGHDGNEADAEGDTPMGGVESHHTSHDKSTETQQTHTTSSFGNRESAQPRPLHSLTAPSQQLLKESGLSAPRSQTGPFTPLPQGTHPTELQNDASTTQSTSQKKTSSHDTEDHNQHDSGPNLYLLDERRSAGGSQIPSTQGNLPASQDIMDPLAGPAGRPTSSQGQSQPAERSSQPPVPLFDGAATERRPSRSNGGLSGLHDLLNPPSPSSSALRPNLVQVEERKLDNFHAELRDQTSGLSVEQLEQVNSVLMDTLWKTRDQWDRGKVLEELSGKFNEVIDDMRKSGQEFEPGSWGKKN